MSNYPTLAPEAYLEAFEKYLENGELFMSACLAVNGYSVRKSKCPNWFKTKKRWFDGNAAAYAAFDKESVMRAFAQYAFDPCLMENDKPVGDYWNCDALNLFIQLTVGIQQNTIFDDGDALREKIRFFFADARPLVFMELARSQRGFMEFDYVLHQDSGLPMKRYFAKKMKDGSTPVIKLGVPPNFTLADWEFEAWLKEFVKWLAIYVNKPKGKAA